MVRIRTPFNLDTFLTKVETGKTMLTFHKKQIIFSQGDTADEVCYVQAGKVKLTVISTHGKEAVVAILESGAFVGESWVGQTVRRRRQRPWKTPRFSASTKPSCSACFKSNPRSPRHLCPMSCCTRFESKRI